MFYEQCAPQSPRFSDVRSISAVPCLTGDTQSPFSARLNRRANLGSAVELYVQFYPLTRPFDSLDILDKTLPDGVGCLLTGGAEKFRVPGNTEKQEVYMGRNRSKVRKGERVMRMVTRNALYEINGSVLLKPCPECGRVHRAREGWEEGVS